MLKDLVKLANHLDAKGLRKEADYIDNLIKKADPLLTAYNMYKRRSEEDPLDAVDQQEEAAALAEQVRKAKKDQKRLLDTQGWVSTNLYYSTEDPSSKFPIFADRELVFQISPDYGMVVPAQTEFSSLDEPVSLKNGRKQSLRKLINALNLQIKKLSNWIEENDR